jgi:hypothetical protein
MLPRARMSTDRDGTDEDLSEGFFHMPSPLAPARPESHGTRGRARSSRPAQAEQHVTLKIVPSFWWYRTTTHCAIFSGNLMIG